LLYRLQRASSASAKTLHRTELPSAATSPAPLARIVGRDGIIAALTTQLAPRRLLTTVGPIGIGKNHRGGGSRQNCERFLSWYWFVGLAAPFDPIWCQAIQRSAREPSERGGCA
jgi:hypothetical protein